MAVPDAAIQSEAEAALLQQVATLVREHMSQYDPSHDWAHVERVRRMALRIASTLPSADLLVVELAALMHDLTDSKYTTHASLSSIRAGVLDPSPALSSAQADLVLRIIPAVSWSAEQRMRADGTWGAWHAGCPELHAVQDADRLDAVGAVGVLRCAAFSGARGRYLVEEAGGGGEACAGCEGHFYDKLLKIKELMKTGVGRDEAERRHKTMVDFLAALDGERHWVQGDEPDAQTMAGSAC